MPPKKDKAQHDQHIQVVLRCRPLNEKERSKGSWSIVEANHERREVSVKERPSPTAPLKTFTFDRVFGPQAKQIEVYKSVVVPMIDEVLQGYNCTVFAYGQTGTGKTFTMEGEKTEGEGLTWENDPLTGIIPRTMHQLFTRLQKQKNEFTVKVSFLEIYNEELIDLLGAESVENPRLKIYEDVARKGSCVIQGLEEVTVHDKNEVYHLLEVGSTRRQTAATQMNAHSSRSHTLFMVTVHIKENTLEGEELLKIGKFNLVDLAGSENIGRSGAVEKRAREAGQINQSLLTLGRVITALVEKTPHIPYRESKLTRLLQDSLGGRTKTSIIATISPANLCHDETLSTLDYAHRAKNITNRPEVNQKLTKKELLKEYTEEIERMRRDLQAARDKNGVYIAQENYDALHVQIQQGLETINTLQDNILMMTSEMEKLEDMFKEQTLDLKDTRTNLRHTKQDRDEQRHLVTKHVNAEGKLTSQAKQLLGTADTATSDVEGLHSKVDRTKDTDRHNISTREAFSIRMNGELDEMEASIKNFSEGQSEGNTSIGCNLENIAKSHSSDFEEMCSKLEGVKSNIKKKKVPTATLR